MIINLNLNLKFKSYICVIYLIVYTLSISVYMINSIIFFYSNDIAVVEQFIGLRSKDKGKKIVE